MQPLLADGLLGLSAVQVALLLSGVALIFALRRWRQVVARKKAAEARDLSAFSDDPPASPAPAATNPLSVREVASELSALLADLEETSRRVAAQIDNRRARLDLLLQEADEKIRRLEALTRAGSDPARSLSPSFPAEPRPIPTITTAHDAAQTLSRLRQERGAPSPSEDPAYRPIYQLADAGKSTREIAQELGRQPGEIELILALRGRQRVG